MNQPIIKGETLYKAIWPRNAMGMRLLTGKAELADDHNFYVTYAEGGESLPQAHPDGWCRTRQEAMEHLLQRLAASESYIQTDLTKVRARILRVKTTRANLAAQEV